MLGPYLQATHIVDGSVKTHSHEKDFNFIEGLKVREAIKSCAEVSRGQTGQIVVDNLTRHSSEVIVASGSIEAHKQVVRRIRRGKRPKSPKKN